MGSRRSSSCHTIHSYSSLCTFLCLVLPGGIFNCPPPPCPIYASLCLDLDFGFVSIYLLWPCRSPSFHFHPSVLALVYHTHLSVTMEGAEAEQMTLTVQIVMCPFFWQRGGEKKRNCPFLIKETILRIASIWHCSLRLGEKHSETWRTRWRAQLCQGQGRQKALHPTSTAWQSAAMFPTTCTVLSGCTFSTFLQDVTGFVENVLE